eukprot:scaffold170364_cov25-Tisochrysis_lutea.AAC.1
MRNETALSASAECRPCFHSSYSSWALGVSPDLPQRHYADTCPFGPAIMMNDGVNISARSSQANSSMKWRLSCIRVNTKEMYAVRSEGRGHYEVKGRTQYGMQAIQWSEGTALSEGNTMD